MSKFVKIAVASDHAGFAAKEEIKKYLAGKGYEVKDFGCFSKESCDYPDFVFPAAQAVAKGDLDKGIFICGSGNGVNIVANKVRGIRAAVAYNKETARLAAEDTGCNVISFGAKFMKIEDIKERIDVWLLASVPTGRHKRRVEKITRGEKCYRQK